MFIVGSSTSSAVQFITVLLIFAFVLFICFFTTKFVGNFQKERLSGSNIAQNKYIQIVKIADRYFAIAVCKDTVTTISEIPADSISFPEEQTEKISFKDFLKKAKEEEKDS